MTTQKDFKRLVRSRMARTGEAYTTARTHLLRRSRGAGAGSRTGRAAAASGAATTTSAAQAANQAASIAALAPTPAAPKPAEYARIAGMSDAAVKKATGCTWEKWVGALDYAGAQEWPHRAITDHIRTKYKTPDWWTQMVTVGYERIKGLRDKGQRRGGGYEASRSRTVPVPVAKLYRAFADARTRGRWLEGVTPTVRTAQKDRSIRMTWPDGTWVMAWLTAKGAGKSSVQVQHTKLASKADAEARKAYWGDRLDALAALLATAAPKPAAAKRKARPARKAK